jgi:predicted nucleic acid-binding protein
VGFLIDTCVWIDVERGALAPADVAAFTGDEPVYLSPVTIAELKFGAEVAAMHESGRSA